MKAVLVIDSISRAAGGLLDAERCLHQGLRRMGVRTAVFALEDAHTPDDLPGWTPLSPTVFPHRGPAAFGWSADLRRAILAETGDLIYRAGLWRLPSRYAHEWSRRHGRPEIIAPHGMLDPWAVRNSHWKKVLAHACYEGAHLRNASCIRALCESEAQAIRAYGLTNPICVIPNGVELPKEARDQRPETRDQRKTLLFLGRLHPKKGLVNALRAWKTYLQSTIHDPRSSEWQFVVAGWDQGGHEAELKRLCGEIGVSVASVSVDRFLSDSSQDPRTPLGKSATVIDTPLQATSGRAAAGTPYRSTETPKHRNTEIPASVIFTGPAFGETKDLLLRRADAFILPSFSEGLPMSVLEAWAYRLPVLMTEHCNLPEGFLADAALRIGTDVESIAEGMHDLLRSPASDLRSLGDNGRRLVEERFAWPQIAAQMKEVYEWILGGGVVPDCVRQF
jgi:poly(glycerol-phosphate) alpha-glucosyltransferase